MALSTREEENIIVGEKKFREEVHCRQVQREIEAKLSWEKSQAWLVPLQRRYAPKNSPTRSLETSFLALGWVQFLPRGLNPGSPFDAAQVHGFAARSLPQRSPPTQLGRGSPSHDAAPRLASPHSPHGERRASHRSETAPAAQPTTRRGNWPFQPLPQSPPSHFLFNPRPRTLTLLLPFPHPPRRSHRLRRPQPDELRSTASARAMELKLTYTADGVELRKDDRCPRPATTADLVPGQGTSAPRVPTSSPEHVNATVVVPTEHHGIPAAPYRRSSLDLTHRAAHAGKDSHSSGPASSAWLVAFSETRIPQLLAILLVMLSTRGVLSLVVMSA